jgi:hypothetical protein
MTRILRFSLLVLVICALSSPAFAIICTACNDQGVCDSSPDSGTRCIEHIDYCEDFSANCSGVMDESTLADHLAIASVDVVTPNGVTKTNVTPRIAEHKTFVKLAAAPSAR